ncbi:UDP-2,4-diacetamido-2,4,6-trideoxy-beta-L-altropyranose hydrolase [Arenibacter sp. F26102]|uniref:UDP-2,4-diacetamido-2,4, 6-trideoxy-beta-L-altropyranose hydrolase n=1 Tax=Arenibacter sp. F26102 TaxID=2926416 RepID=UPI001FF670AE|nr:UDP-2,4-diacetamido-2,4,6-trideoxy-beta-L-altropyranose hydrolase [Arenibacter sp. F26102]MCK0144111.1 UDP-2,4-diacetamido-2,4,6-trideoxy-beta-L-altropyranose hydrolase [Arenibacter sp. F26102]
MKKKIIFRADGNSEIGLGHLYRLFALVEMYKDEYDFVFLTKKDTLLDVIPLNYKVKTIPNHVNINREPIWVFENFPPEEYILIADGYQFVSAYQKKIKELGYILIYVDDLANEHMYADLVVNHSPHITDVQYKKEKYTKFALGTDYAILRPSFLKVSLGNRDIKSLSNVFVCFGGADKNNFTYKIMLELLNIPEIKKINLVVGGAYKYPEIFEVEKKNSKVKIFKNLNEKSLHTLMDTCNFAVAPTSTILLELISVNMYLVSGYYVENQRMAYYEFERRAVFKGLGDFNKYQFDFLKNHLINVSANDIKNQIEAQRMLIDGNQKRRFLKLMNKLS